jgi:hypothetical protein
MGWDSWKIILSDYNNLPGKTDENHKPDIQQWPLTPGICQTHVNHSISKLYLVDRIIRFLDFGHCPLFQKPQNTFWKLHLFRKYKESAHMAWLTNPISQPSLDIYPIWIPLIINVVTNSQRKWNHQKFFVGYGKEILSWASVYDWQQ